MLDHDFYYYCYHQSRKCLVSQVVDQFLKVMGSTAQKVVHFNECIIYYKQSWSELYRTTCNTMLFN